MRNFLLAGALGLGVLMSGCAERAYMAPREEAPIMEREPLGEREGVLENEGIGEEGIGEREGVLGEEGLGEEGLGEGRLDEGVGLGD